MDCGDATRHRHLEIADWLSFQEPLLQIAAELISPGPLRPRRCDKGEQCLRIAISARPHQLALTKVSAIKT
jgi:hypothetical protein